MRREMGVLENGGRKDGRLGKKRDRLMEREEHSIFISMSKKISALSHSSFTAVILQY